MINKNKDVAGEYDLILGFPIARNFESNFRKSTAKFEGAKFYDLSERVVNRKYSKRIIMPAVGQGAITYTGDSHLMTIAPTGSGKGRSVIIPNLLHYNGPVIVVDPKGENYAVTAKYRKEVLGHKVVVLDPFRVTNAKSDGLNPFDIFTLDNADIETDAQALAELLSEGNRFSSDPFWDLAACGLYSGLIAYMVSVLEKKEWNMNKLRDIIMGDDTVYNLAVMLDTQGKKMKKMAYQEITSFLQMPDEKTRPSVKATALGYLKSFTSDRVGSTLEKSSFSLEEVVNGDKLSIYIIIPPDKLKSHRGLLKVWVNTLMKAITSRKEIPEHRTLFILDECGQLGSFPFLETAITLLRGYGLQTWTFWQDLSQLRKLYEIEWSTMVNNCAVLQIFGTKNYRVASEFSEMVGVETDQVSDVRASEQILLIDGEDLLKTMRFDYLKNKEFEGKYEDNPLYKNVKIK
jgi:type IV secretion system protein VirD4